MIGRVLSKPTPTFELFELFEVFTIREIEDVSLALASEVPIDVIIDESINGMLLVQTW